MYDVVTENAALHPEDRGLQALLACRQPAVFLGVYDVFSAVLAGRHYQQLFLSGFGFSASFYGLPDHGYIAWADMVAFAQRVQIVLPRHKLLVDIDDGYCDPATACHVVRLLESIGVAGVVLEDQQRPRRCGHLDGKRILPLDEYVEKLQQVLAARRHMTVVARTDATDPGEILRRVEAFDAAGADALLVDAVRDLQMIRALREVTPKPLFFNQIAGGKSPPVTLRALEEAGISGVIYSTPCLFAAQSAIEDALTHLRENDGLLDVRRHGVGVADCTGLLVGNSTHPAGEPKEQERIESP